MDSEFCVIDVETTGFSPRLGERLDGAVFVAHNLRFDWGFIAAEFERAGQTLPP